MTEHPITPPPELVRHWDKEAVTAPMADQLYIAIQAARWGADQELEACCEWQDTFNYPNASNLLRAARRPKPPSLSEPAIAVLDDASDRLDAVHENVLRRALERLQELEGAK